MIDLNQKCFTRCVKISPPPSLPLVDRVSSLVINKEKEIKRLSEDETLCIDKCATAYVKMLSHMIDNFEKRTTF